MHPLIHASSIMQPPPGMVLVSAEEAMRVRALAAAPTADPRWRQVYACVWGDFSSVCEGWGEYGDDILYFFLLFVYL